MTYKDNVAPFPAIFALKNTRVHICTTNSSNVTSNIEASIN